MNRRGWMRSAQRRVVDGLSRHSGECVTERRRGPNPGTSSERRSPPQPREARMADANPLLDEPVIVVTQKPKFLSARAEYDLYRPDGTAIGFVEEEPSIGGLFARQ